MAAFKRSSTDRRANTMRIPSNHLAVYMAEIINQWRALMDREAKKIGLSRPEWRVFFAISSSHQSRFTQLDIANTLAMDQGLVTRVLDKLEGKSLVRRTVDQYDQRVRNISLTEESRPLFEKLSDILNGIQSKVLENFSDEERSSLQSYFERIRNAVSDAAR